MEFRDAVRWVALNWVILRLHRVSHGLSSALGYGTARTVERLARKTGVGAFLAVLFQVNSMFLPSISNIMDFTPC